MRSNENLATATDRRPRLSTTTSGKDEAFAPGLVELTGESLYLGKLRQLERLTRDEESDLARRLQSARRAFARWLAELPAEALHEVLDGDPRSTIPEDGWSLREMAVYYDRAVGCADRSGDESWLAATRRLLRYKRQVEHARDALVVSNLSLVPFIVRRIPGTQRNFADLVQEGNLGLMTAVEKYDPTRGCRFSTYATWWIRQAVQKALGDKLREIRLPAHVHGRLQAVARLVRELRQELRRTPTIDELAERSKLPLDLLHELRVAASRPLPLEAFGAEDDEPSVLDRHADPDTPDPLEATLRKETIEQAPKVLDVLSVRDRKILRLRFGLEGEPPLTLREIGKRFGLSREGVRQIEARALAELRARESTPEATRGSRCEEPRAHHDAQLKHQSPPGPQPPARTAARHVEPEPLVSERIPLVRNSEQSPTTLTVNQASCRNTPSAVDQNFLAKLRPYTTEVSDRSTFRAWP